MTIRSSYRIERCHKYGKRVRVLKRGLTLAEAQAHVDSREARGEDERGEWYDTYRIEPGTQQIAGA